MFCRLFVSVRVQGERHKEEEGDGGGVGGRSAGNAQEEEKGESANALPSLYQVEKLTLHMSTITAVIALFPREQTQFT